MSKYYELFKNPKWQKKRLEILDRDMWKCQMCGGKESTLHVHHKWYVPNKKPWEYNGLSLVTLCDGCHKSEHEIKSTAISLLSAAFLSKGLFYDDFIDVVQVLQKMTQEEFDCFIKRRPKDER